MKRAEASRQRRRTSWGSSVPPCHGTNYFTCFENCVLISVFSILRERNLFKLLEQVRDGLCYNIAPESRQQGTEMDWGEEGKGGPG